MTFQQDPNAPDFAAIYGTQTATTGAPDIMTELASIGVTSLAGLTDAQLSEIATRLDAHRTQVVSQQATSQAANQQAQQANLDASTQALNAQTAQFGAQTTAANAPAPATEPAKPALDPNAWLAYLQKVGPEGYGGDPAAYANAVYDAHYQVASAGGTGSAPGSAKPISAPAGEISKGAGPGVDYSAAIAKVNQYITNLQADKTQTPAQKAELGMYQARLADYTSRQAAPAVTQPTPAGPAAQPNQPAAQIAQPAVPASGSVANPQSELHGHAAEVAAADKAVQDAAWVKRATQDTYPGVNPPSSIADAGRWLTDMTPHLMADKSWAGNAVFAAQSAAAKAQPPQPDQTPADAPVSYFGPGVQSTANLAQPGISAYQSVQGIAKVTQPVVPKVVQPVAPKANTTAVGTVQLSAYQKRQAGLP